MAQAQSILMSEEPEEEIDTEVEAAENDSESSEDAPAATASEPAEPARARVEEPSNFLSLYFRDMSRLNVLKPQQEFEWAENIENLEIALWAELIEYRPLLQHTLAFIEKSGMKLAPKVKALRRAVPAAKTAQATARFHKRALEAGKLVRAADDDHHLLDALLADRKLLQQGHVTRLLVKSPSFNVKSKNFGEHLLRVNRAYLHAQRVKNEFVKANLRLVVSIARRFNYGKMALPDLIQEGNIGLIKAVERYDFRRGYRFSTYASWWIRHAISRALADKGREIRLPVHMLDAYYRINKAQRNLTTTLERAPTSEEIGAATGIPTAKVDKMRTFILDQAVSLDKQVGDEDERRFVDMLKAPEPDHSEEMMDDTLAKEVWSQLADLRPIEADILKKRFGLETDEEQTLKEIGDEYHLSRERIRQLQEQALGKIRRAFKRKDML